MRSLILAVLSAALAFPALAETLPVLRHTDVRVTPATTPADRVLPGFCRQRRVDGYGQAVPSITLTRARWDGEKLREMEVADSTGEFLYRMVPTFDAAGNVKELALRETDRKTLEKRSFRRDAQGRLVAETWQRTGERRPYFERQLAYGPSGTPTAETWRWNGVSWKLTPRLDARGQVVALVRDDGRAAVRYVRDGQGNVLLESRSEPAGNEVRIVNDLACFGFDETALHKLAEQCEGGEGTSCNEVARWVTADGRALGLAPDPAIAEAYDERGCASGVGASCASLAAAERDERRASGLLGMASDLLRRECERGDAGSCRRACALGDTGSCQAVAVQE